VLGYYFQTERGKKLPRRKKNGTYMDPEADKDDKAHPKTQAEKDDERDRAERERDKEAAENKQEKENRD